MPKFDNYVFVLWGSGFEEATAAIFVTELRQAGLRVKVVSLNSQQISGASGLVLLPDWTLGKALPLATQATCVIIPSASSDIKQLKSDPRLCQFIAQAQASQAKFVIKQLNEVALTDLGLLPKNDVIIYPGGKDLIEFVRELARSLTIVEP